MKCHKISPNQCSLRAILLPVFGISTFQIHCLKTREILSVCMCLILLSMRTRHQMVAWCQMPSQFNPLLSDVSCNIISTHYVLWHHAKNFVVVLKNLYVIINTSKTKWLLFCRWHFKCISLNENFWILNKISLKYVPYDLIDNMIALVQIMAWCSTGDKRLSEPMLVCCTDASFSLNELMKR